VRIIAFPAAQVSIEQKQIGVPPDLRWVIIVGVKLIEVPQPFIESLFVWGASRLAEPSICQPHRCGNRFSKLSHGLIFRSKGTVAFPRIMA
jgi:hypothetical protein